MNNLLLVALAAVSWCAGHSFFTSHFWRDRICARITGCPVYGRLIYVVFSCVSLATFFWWLRSLPRIPIWDWAGLWLGVRILGLATAGGLFVLGARAHDGKFFLGLRQISQRHSPRNADQDTLPTSGMLSTSGILAVIRHPWYTASLIFLIFCLPFTDVNLVWRVVFAIYIVVGTELEERKLSRDLGEVYTEYRRRVPRFFPIPGRRLGG